MSNDNQWYTDKVIELMLVQKSLICSYNFYNEKHFAVVGGKEEPAALWSVISVINDYNKSIYTLTRELLTGLDNQYHIPITPFESVYMFMPNVGGVWLTIDPSIPVQTQMDGFVIEPTILLLGGLPSGTMVFTNNITITIP